MDVCVYESWNSVNWSNSCPVVTLQNAGLNMAPQGEESTELIETLSIVRPRTTRDYQISLIESRGPNSRGVRLLRAGLDAIGKTYVPAGVATTVPFTIFDLQGADPNTTPSVDISTAPRQTIRLTRPLPTRAQQIALIESRGPNSRGVRMLHAGHADIAKTASLHPGQPTVTPPPFGTHYT